MAYYFMQEFGFHNMVSDGGNSVTIDGKLMGIEPLDKTDALQLIEECEEKGIAWAISPDNKKRRIAPNPHFSRITGAAYM